MNKKAETMGLVYLLLLSILISYGYSVSADITLDDGTVIQVDNENYSFPDSGLTFSSVSFDESGKIINIITREMDIRNFIENHRINIDLEKKDSRIKNRLHIITDWKNVLL